MKPSKLLVDWLAVTAIVMTLTVFSFAQSNETVLYTFTYHTDGGMPFAGLTFDAKGNLYGTAYFAGYIAGSVCCGSVFQLIPDGAGAWTFNTLFDFTGPITGGEAPVGSVVIDASGNLYGTTQIGGFCGTAYELSPTPQGAWKQTTLHRFNNLELGVTDDGCLPSSYLIFDQAGNLYGTTQQTGANDCMGSTGCGTVFELSPAENGKWIEKIIHRFSTGTRSDGSGPYGGLVFDKAGNLWGTTLSGGTAGVGTIFELSPAAGGGWTERVAFNFTGNSTGYTPYAGLVIDAAGSFYGTTYVGGVNGNGSVFRMRLNSDGQLTETILHSFAACSAEECPDGVAPFGGLVLDAAGNLYGTTSVGGAAGSACVSYTGQLVGCGVLFKVTPQTNGSWDYSIVHRFPGNAEGGFPTDDHLAVDPNGNIFGTTFVEGDVGNSSICPQEVLGLGGCGVVFEITQ